MCVEIVHTDFVTIFPASLKGQDIYFFAGTVVTARQNVFAFFNPSPSSRSLRCWHFVRRPSCAPERVLSRRRGGGGGGLTVAIRGIIFALIIYPSLRSPLLSYVTVGWEKEQRPILVRGFTLYIFLEDHAVVGKLGSGISML